MPPFASHIFICCNQREPGHARGCCDVDGDERLRSAFQAELKKHDLALPARANRPVASINASMGRRW